jgi:leucyl-tRNA synthetase
LEPFVPHISHQLSHTLFEGKNLGKVEIDSDALKSEEVLYPVSVNGKKRGEISVPVDASKEEILEKARQRVEKYLTGKEIVREVFVPGRIINFVVKG